MTYRFEFDPANGILRVCYAGDIGDELLRKCYKDTPQAVGRTNPRAIIIDLSEVTSFDVSPQIIYELAEYKPTVKDPAIPRIIVAPTPHMFGMARMFQIIGGHSRPMLQVVNSLKVAYAELDITKPQFELLTEK